MTSNSTIANSIPELENSRGEISSSPYLMFKFSTRSEITRKYYERRIRLFLDFTKFNIENKTNIEKRCNAFAGKGRSEINWAVEQIVKFLQFQKDRVEKGEITAATYEKPNVTEALKSAFDFFGVSEEEVGKILQDIYSLGDQRNI